MKIKKELTIKEKIIISLEEPTKESKMVSGFISILFACAITSAALTITTNELSKLNMEVNKNGRNK